MGKIYEKGLDRGAYRGVGGELKISEWLPKSETSFVLNATKLWKTTYIIFFLKGDGNKFCNLLGS